ncbi:hypothetical protein BU17DRAFT_95962 [Hysterangium stoloniferum]|nr:hypothetical protein BU17DRAFT_95962 [Hysterangium stoloniferum]
MDEITRTADVIGLLPAAVTIADFQPNNDEIMRITNAHNMLREQWSCDEPGHELCLQGNEFVGHIQLSKEQISIWIGEICRGQAACRYPPKVFIVPDGSGSNRNPNFDWDASETTTDTEAEIEPGYFCGLVQERIGRIFLYHSKVALSFVKLLFYDRKVNRHYEVAGRLYKRPSARMLGIILQETVDLMRSSYPICIRERASGLFRTLPLLRGRWDDHIILECLGYAFRDSTRDHVPRDIISALYWNLMREQLHIHYEEVLSTFVVIFARYLAASWELDHFPLSTFAFLAANLCYLRKLSFKELDAIHDYLEFWLQKRSSYGNRDRLDFICHHMSVSTTCSQQDARFHIFSEALLDIALDTTIGTPSRHPDLALFLEDKGLAVNRFFANRVMLTDDVKKISRIASFIAFYPPIQTPLSIGFINFAGTIQTITSLIAASPNPEYYCRKIRAENVVNAFLKFFSLFGPPDFLQSPLRFGRLFTFENCLALPLTPHRQSVHWSFGPIQLVLLVDTEAQWMGQKRSSCVQFSEYFLPSLPS